MRGDGSPSTPLRGVFCNLSPKKAIGCLSILAIKTNRPASFTQFTKTNLTSHLARTRRARRKGETRGADPRVRLIHQQWLALFGFAKLRHRLTPGESGVYFVPVPDALLAQFPAEEDVAAFVAPGEVDQTRLVVLQFDAERPQFINVILKAVEGRVELILRVCAVLRRCRQFFDLRLELRGPLVGVDDVAHDARDERQRAVGLGERVAPLRLVVRPVLRLEGGELWSRHSSALSQKDLHHDLRDPRTLRLRSLCPMH